MRSEIETHVPYWSSLPEWAKWILCWPIIILFDVLAALLCHYWASKILDRFFISENVAKLLIPSVVVVFQIPLMFILIYIFVPRKKTFVSGVLVFIYTAFGIILVTLAYIQRDWSNPSDFIQTATCVVTSWVSFFGFKEEFTIDD